MTDKKDGRFMSSVKVGPKGQIVIPAEVREMFGIIPGDTLLLLADMEKGVAIPPKNKTYDIVAKIMSKFSGGPDITEGDDDLI
ncbi:MAG: AbrB/MazE/SpoVT family DNA-binding domain-containing protein [Clostridiales bacterium]|nr:AbrB/MazE/SpoVT family DNA-binding domain-containing protein [Clostridiales bacterium]